MPSHVHTIIPITGAKINDYEIFQQYFFQKIQSCPHQAYFDVCDGPTLSQGIFKYGLGVVVEFLSQKR